MRETPELCPICNKPATAPFRPFCSRRCADIDLGRWFSGTYAIPTTGDDDPELPPDGEDMPEKKLTQG